MLGIPGTRTNSTKAAPQKMGRNGRYGATAIHQPTIMTATTAAGSTDIGQRGRPITRRGKGTRPEASTATSTLSLNGMMERRTAHMVNVKPGEEEGAGRGVG